jgi:hypothetical protein
VIDDAGEFAVVALVGALIYPDSHDPREIVGPIVYVGLDPFYDRSDASSRGPRELGHRGARISEVKFGSSPNVKTSCRLVGRLYLRSSEAVFVVDPNPYRDPAMTAPAFRRIGRVLPAHRDRPLAGARC